MEQVVFPRGHGTYSNVQRIILDRSLFLGYRAINILQVVASRVQAVIHITVTPSHSPALQYVYRNSACRINLAAVSSQSNCDACGNLPAMIHLR